jgi:hypothetical protein
MGLRGIVRTILSGSCSCALVYFEVLFYHSYARWQHQCVRTRYAVRAEALFLLGDLDDAMRLVRQGLKLNPDDVYGKRVFKRLRAVQRGIAEAKVAGERRDFAVVVSQYSDMIGMQIPDKVGSLMPCTPCSLVGRLASRVLMAS